MEFIAKDKKESAEAKLRKENLKKLIERIHQGLSEEEALAQFKKDFGSVTAEELSQAEDALIQEGTSVREIQRLCDVHAKVFQNGIEFISKDREQALDETPGHPAFLLKTENQVLAKFLKDDLIPLTEQAETEGNSDLLTDLLFPLKKIPEHYSRKENVIFPYLEKAGVMGPPQVMWGADDLIRQEIKDFTSLVQSGQTQGMGAKGKALANSIQSMVDKETKILLPMIMEKFQPQDWRTIAEDSLNFDQFFAATTEGASPSDAREWLAQEHGTTLNDPKLSTESTSQGNLTNNPELVELPSGSFNLKQLEGLLNTIPTEITFIDAQDRVRYINNPGAKKIFPRTLSILGREVYNCHPPKSQVIVERLINDFKEGKKDIDIVSFKRGNSLILIRYLAVRDEQGEYLGTLETVEDIAAYPGVNLEDPSLLSSRHAKPSNQ